MMGERAGGGFTMFRHADTGGGCTALVAIVDRGRFVITTHHGDCIPTGNEPALLGFYPGTDWTDGGEGEVTDHDDLQAAIQAAQAQASAGESDE